MGLFDFFGRVSPLDGESDLPLFRASDLGYFNMGSTSLGDGVCIVTTTRVLPPRSSSGGGGVGVHNARNRDARGGVCFIVP